MKVAEEPAEEGILVDRWVQAESRHHGVDDATGTPPPPVVGREEGSAHAGRVEALDAHGLPEALGADSPGVEHLEHALQVAEETQHQRAQQPEAEGSVEPRAHAEGNGADQAHGAHRGHRWQQRQRKVVHHTRRNPRRHAGHTHRQVAEIVVADAMTGEPRVHRWEGGRDHGGVEKGKVHGLLCVADSRHARPHNCPQSEDREEDCLRREQEPPFAPHKADELRPEPPRERRRSDGKGNEDERGSRARAEGDLGAAQEPYGVGEHEHAQGLREAETPVPQRGKEDVGERQRQQAQRLDNEEPENDVRHEATFGLGTGGGVAGPGRVITGCR